MRPGSPSHRFPVIHKNTIVKRMPFTIEVDVRAHQTPFKPIIPPNTTANGILAPVMAILIILQSLVIPRPDNAPIVVSSTHIKASLKPMITR